MFTLRIALIVFLAAVAIGYSQANPKVEQDAKTIKVQTELIQVRAVVTDREGRPIDGLTKDDFLLLEDRVEQPVSFFSLEKVEGKLPVRPAPARENDPVTSNADLDRGGHPSSSRSLVLLVDTAHLGHGSIEAVRTALKRFVDEQLTDQDLVAIMTTAGKPGVKGDFTRDRNKLREEVKKFRLWQLPSESLLTPSLCGKVVRREPQAVTLAGQIIESEYRTMWGVLYDATSACRLILMEASHRRNMVMSSLKTVTEKLAALPGQRIVALFSDGFSMTAIGGEIAITDIRPALSRAVRDGIVLYSFDAKGLMPVMLSASQIYPSLAKNNEVMSEMHDSVRDIQLGVTALAVETGGQAFFNTNDFNRFMQQMLDNNRIYYELTYYPPLDKDPAKFRDISVLVKNHPEYRVRAQKGYVLRDLRRGK